MAHSLSKYGTYRGCPARYEFRYIKLLPEPKGAAASRGTDLHAKLETALIERHLLGIPEMSLFVKVEAQRMITLGYAPEVKLAVNNKWEKVEWDSPDAWLRSVIDSILPVTHLAMGEWKSGKVWDDHADQRDLYTVMALSCYTNAESASIKTIYLDQGIAVEHALKRADLAARQADWTERFTEMEKDTFFSPRPGRQCSWCAFSSRRAGPCRF
jgi:PD-(D/E)XK nuclease superfamily